MYGGLLHLNCAGHGHEDELMPQAVHDASFAEDLPARDVLLVPVVVNEKFMGGTT